MMSVTGYLPMKIVNFIMNMRITDKRFYLSRHGQSEYNVVGRIGGDSGKLAIITSPCCHLCHAYMLWTDLLTATD